MTDHAALPMWLTGPSDDECRTVLDAARASGALDTGDVSVVFHDLDLLEARIAELSDTFPAGTLHALAVKANPLVAVLAVAVGAGAGLEAASIEEVHLAIAAGCPSDRIVYDSPAKTRDEIDEALRLGIRLNVDNLDELDRVLGSEAGTGASIVGVRVNPMVREGTIGTTSVGGGRSRFGLPFDVAMAELPARFAEHESLRGVHVHVGSQGTSLDMLVEAAVRIDELRDTVEAATRHGRVTAIDLGGGLPARYVSEEPPTPGQYAAALHDAAPGLFDGRAQLVTEFGRAVQANCGWAVSRVEYVKQTTAGPVAVIHLGADFLMRPAYQPDHWRHRFTLVESAASGSSSADDDWTIAGPLCFAGDVVGRGVPLGAVVPGDEIIVHDVGAYTLSMWSRHCSRGMPLVLGYRGRREPEFTVLRRAERPADVVRFWQPGV